MFSENLDFLEIIVNLVYFKILKKLQINVSGYKKLYLIKLVYVKIITLQVKPIAPH